MITGECNPCKKNNYYERTTLCLLIKFLVYKKKFKYLFFGFIEEEEKEGIGIVIIKYLINYYSYQLKNTR